MAQEMQKLSVELSKSLVTRLTWWSGKMGMSGSEAISYFCRVGMAVHDKNDTLNYMAYRTRQEAKHKKVAS